MARIDPPPLTEAVLARQLGVARADLKKIRGEKLTADLDYRLTPAGIEITPAGEKKVRAALALPVQPSAPSLPLPWQGNDAEARRHNGVDRPPAALRVTLTVVKPTRARMIVDCLTASGAQVRLRVKDNANFTPGMQLKNCIHVEADRYDYEGRLPRRKGRL